MTLPASHVDLDDLDPVSDDEVPPDENDDAMGTTMLSGVDGLDGSASDLRVELAVPQEVEDIPAPLLVEADAQLDMSQHALEMDYDDEVLQIGRGREDVFSSLPRTSRPPRPKFDSSGSVDMSENSPRPSRWHEAS